MSGNDSEWTDCDTDDEGDEDWLPETDDEDNMSDQSDENSADTVSDIEYESDSSDEDGTGESVLNHASEDTSNQMISSPLPHLVWDNTQLQQYARHQSKEKENEMLLWTNAMAVIGRIIFQLGGDQVRNASDIPFEYIFLGPDDRKRLREYIKAIMGRIGVRNIPHYEGYKDVVTWHVKHQYSEEMKQKSTVVCIPCFNTYHCETLRLKGTFWGPGHCIWAPNCAYLKKFVPQ